MKLYKKGADTSYTLGVFPTIELLKHQPDKVRRVVVSSTIEENRGWPLIQELTQKAGIPVDVHDPTLAKLSGKGNCFAAGIFDIYRQPLENGSHVVLVNPMDMGNMGTIMRTMLGFDIRNLAIIRPAVDIDDPKVIRASMGAVFSLNVAYFDDFASYRDQFGKGRHMYLFMLKGAANIHKVKPEGTYSLIFGNESSGLDDSYLEVGQSVFIPHTDAIDSLNLSMSLGIGLYHFTKDEFIDQTVLR